MPVASMLYITIFVAVQGCVAMPVDSVGDAPHISSKSLILIIVVAILLAVLSFMAFIAFWNHSSCFGNIMWRQDILPATARSATSHTRASFVRNSSGGPWVLPSQKRSAAAPSVFFGGRPVSEASFVHGSPIHAAPSYPKQAIKSKLKSPIAGPC